MIYNNRGYRGPKQGIHDLYGSDSFCFRNKEWADCDIEPSPEYSLVAKACGAYGTTVEDPSDILPALSEAMDHVREGKAAVVDVRIE